jgi:WD repeat-containing protein 48
VICRDGDGDSGSEGINSIVAADDAFIWTATGSSTIKCWRDVESRSKRYKGARLTSGLQLEMTPPVGSEDTTPLLGRPGSSPAPTDVARGADAWRRDLMQNSTPSPRERDGNDRERPTVSFADESPIPESQGWPTFRSSPANRPVHRPPSLKPTNLSSHRHTLSDSPSLMSAQSFVTSIPPLTGSPTLCGIPYDALVPLYMPDDPYPPALIRGHDDVATLYSTASLVSVPNFKSFGHHSAGRRSVSHDFSSMGHAGQSLHRFSEHAEYEHDPETHSALLARQEYEMRESVQDAVPLRSMPEASIQGRHGLIRSEMLNDRRHVLTIDTAGEVAVWDIVLCKCVGVFYFDDIALSLHYQPPSSNEKRPFPSKAALELVKGRIEGEGTVFPWCTIDTHTGSLNVHVGEVNYSDGEVYADDSGLPGAAEWKDDARISLGRVVLRGLFEGFIKAEVSSRVPVDPTTPLAGPPLSQQKPTSISLPALSANGARPVRKPLTGSSISLATPALTPALPPSANDRLAIAAAQPPLYSPSAEATVASATTASEDAKGSTTDYFSLSTPPNTRPGTAVERPQTAKATDTVSSTDSTGSSCTRVDAQSEGEQKGEQKGETMDPGMVTPHATTVEVLKGDETPKVETESCHILGGIGTNNWKFLTGTRHQ